MRVTISTECRAKLKREAERTGAGPSKLLRGKRGIAPIGLTSSMIHGWTSGRIGTAKSEHLAWVLDTYARWKPPAKRSSTQPEKITITSDLYASLINGVERTGLGAIDILRHAPKPLPEDLNHQKVQRWISGNTKTAIKAHWDLVMRLYASVETKRQ